MFNIVHITSITHSGNVYKREEYCDCFCLDVEIDGFWKPKWTCFKHSNHISSQDRQNIISLIQLLLCVFWKVLWLPNNLLRSFIRLSWNLLCFSPLRYTCINIRRKQLYDLYSKISQWPINMKYNQQIAMEHLLFTRF